MKLFPEILEDKVHPCVLRRGDLVRAVATVVLEAVAGHFRCEPIWLDDAVTEICIRRHSQWEVTTRPGREGWRSHGFP